MTTPTTRRAHQLRQHATDAEQQLWYHLRDRRLAGLKFRRQVPINGYIADFACASARVVVEVDGGQHAELAHRSADAARTQALEAAGYSVVRFWNDDVLARTDQVLEEILRVARCGR